MGTENVEEGAAVLWYDASDGTWSRMNPPISTFAVAECTEIASGEMLFGTWNGGGFSLWLYDEVAEIFTQQTNPVDCK